MNGFVADDVAFPCWDTIIKSMHCNNKSVKKQFFSGKMKIYSKIPFSEIIGYKDIY